MNLPRSLLHRMLWLLAAAVAFVLVALVLDFTRELWEPWTNRYVVTEKFDHHKWTEPETPDTRLRMVEDLLDSYPLRSMSRSEISRLLGNESHPSYPNSLWYVIGDGFADSWVLRIDFNQVDSAIQVVVYES